MASSRPAGGVPVYMGDEAAAESAFAVVCELNRLMKRKPELRHNPYFTALQDTANARFRARFELLP